VATLPFDNRRRLEAIARLGVVERAGDPRLTALARVAADVTGAGSVGVHILDADYQHRVAGIGAPLESQPREDSFCRLVVDGEERIVCRDATQEPRFAWSDHVTGPDPIRFYAAVPLRTSDGATVGALCAWDGGARELTDEQLARFEDLAEQVVAQIELTRIAVDLGHAASHDPLTGAVNRLVLSDRLAQAFGRQLRGGGDVLVALADVDDFKAINDTHGHDAGDEVLREVVRRLLSGTRVQDTVARLGGDEFAVVAEFREGGTGADTLIGRLRAGLAAPIHIAGRLCPVGVTIGVALAQPGDDVRAALARADEAMYERKRAGRVTGLTVTR
jgi:diguanylate cyclase (GGDEF)-like protein